MSRLAVHALTIAALAGVTAAQAVRPQPATAPFTVVEATIADMRTAMERGRTTSRAIVQQSLDRIARYEGRLNAAITVKGAAAGCGRTACTAVTPASAATVRACTARRLMAERYHEP